MEKNEERIGCHTKYFLIKVVLKAVSIDKKISTKESWHSKAEKKTFEINDNFGKQDETSKSSKPFEKFSVCQWAGEAVVGTTVGYAESERVNSKVCEVEGVDEDYNKGNQIKKKCETMIYGISVKQRL